MKCPVCTTTDLLMTERQGVEIDYCPQCRGVWLDRGELDKIIERTGRQAETADLPQYSRSNGMDHGYPPQRHGDSGSQHYGYKPKKKKSLFAELFDFD